MAGLAERAAGLIEEVSWLNARDKCRRRGSAVRHPEKKVRWDARWREAIPLVLKARPAAASITVLSWKKMRAVSDATGSSTVSRELTEQYIAEVILAMAPGAEGKERPDIYQQPCSWGRSSANKK
jgi:hypothetical protein